MNNRLFGLISALLLFAASCQQDGTRLLPNVTGKPGEVVLVINDPIWESEAGEKLNGLLRQPQPALPQPEPMFNLARIEHEAFKSIFRSHRNIIIVNVSPQYEDSRMVVRRNVWAKPQVVIEINTSDITSLYGFVENQQERMLEHLLNAERERHIESYRRYEKTGIANNLSRRHDLRLAIPPGFRMDVDTTNFAWIVQHSLTPRETIKGVFVYYYDYVNPETFSKEFLINKRNEFLRRFVPGPRDGTWMTTEMRLPPHFREFEYNGRYFAELRGLWRVENYFMGGPFVSLTTLDEKNNRIITVEAFVFAPETTKRNLIRQVEAILYTLDIESD